jgi:hypothetical protein
MANHRTMFSMELDVETKERLSARAKAEGYKSLSEYVRKVFEEHLSREESTATTR